MRTTGRSAAGRARAGARLGVRLYPPSGRVPNDLWAQIEVILTEHDPAKPIGRKRIGLRRALAGIIYRLRGGVQWNQLPREFAGDSSVHRTFQALLKLARGLLWYRGAATLRILR